MTTHNELHEGDTVYIIGGVFRWAIGEIHTIGRKKNGVPLYLVSIPYAGPFLYKRDEIERVMPEESRGAV